MFSTTVSIKGLQKFLTSHQVGGAAVACKSAKLHSYKAIRNVRKEADDQVSVNGIA